MRRNWVIAAGAATAINRGSRSSAPQNGIVDCTSASASARTRAKWPSSAIIGSDCHRPNEFDRGSPILSVDREIGVQRKYGMPIVNFGHAHDTGVGKRHRQVSVF